MKRREEVSLVAFSSGGLRRAGGVAGRRRALEWMPVKSVESLALLAGEKSFENRLSRRQEVSKPERRVWGTSSKVDSARVEGIRSSVLRITFDLFFFSVKETDQGRKRKMEKVRTTLLSTQQTRTEKDAKRHWSSLLPRDVLKELQKP